MLLASALDFVIPLRDEGLGNTTYLVEVGGGAALAIDPSLDLRAVRGVAAEQGLRVRWSADTHLHADFLTGSPRLAEDGADLLASAAGGRGYPHHALRDGDTVAVGDFQLTALATPGHTDEHLAYVLTAGDRHDGGTVMAVFSGGSLIVGGAARTDLVSPMRTEELARKQYRSVRRLLALPDDTWLLPTHGAGSFCSSPPGRAAISTIGQEKETNPLLAARDEDDFVDRLLASLGSYPAYFARLPERNRRGPERLTGTPRLAPLDPSRAAALQAAGAVVVDARPARDFAAGHIPGALSIPLRPAFASWLGWLVSPDAPIIVVRNADQSAADIAWAAHKIGYHRIAGEVAGGMTAWRGQGRPVAVVSVVEVGSVASAFDPSTSVVDVRQQAEYDAGHVPGAVHVELGALPAQVPGLPTGPVTLMCAHGERAMTAASLLLQAGRDDVTVLLGGGPQDWTRRAAHRGG